MRNPRFGRTFLALGAALVVVGGGAGIAAAAACLSIVDGSGNISPNVIDFTFQVAHVSDLATLATGIMCHGDKRGTATATAGPGNGQGLVQASVDGSDTEDGKLIKIHLHMDLRENPPGTFKGNFAGTVKVGAAPTLELSGVRREGTFEGATLTISPGCTCQPATQ